MADWHPISDAVTDSDLPPTDDFALIPWSASPTRSNRIDLSEALAWRSRRIWGFVVRIEETNAENTTTPFRIDVMTRINFRADGHSAKTVIALYAPIQAYSANIAITDSVSITLGDAATGIVAANYSGSGRAQLTAWAKSDVPTWSGLSPNALFAEHAFDLEGWTAEWCLVLGGANFAEHAPGKNRIYSVRAVPPCGDPHVYLRGRRARINMEDSGGPFSPPPNLLSIHFLATFPLEGRMWIGDGIWSWVKSAQRTQCPDAVLIYEA